MIYKFASMVNRKIDILKRLLHVMTIVSISSLLGAAPVHTTYLWHLHQPIYWPDQRGSAPDHYETAWDTIRAQSAGRTHPSDSIATIFGIDDRVAAYQFRPRDSLQTILGQPDAGAQVNYSGALIENVNSLAGNFGGYYTGWQNSFIEARSWQTSGGKPRMDIVNFTYHHSLAPLHSRKTFEMEIRLHRRAMELRWGTNPALSRGYFPAEMAFSERLIPVLKSLGIEWAIVSGNHLSRACANFPLVLGSGGENCEPPNRSDVMNPAQSYYWRQQISRGCAPCNAAPFAYTPQRAQWIDPDTGGMQTIVVVPSAQEFSWMDGYQCFGAGGIASVAAQSDASRPELIVLSHDGDNAFAGGYSYYMECVKNFVNGAAAAGHRPSTVEQYLANHPVPADAIVHVEDGGWVNADGDFGSPAFINWLYPLLNASGQPDPVNGWHEKAREYAMFTAVENRIRTTEQASGVPPRIDEVLNPTDAATHIERAWHYYLGSLDSGNVYYGTPGDMEVRSTVGCNNAAARADQALGTSFNDATNPTIFIPQRWPYNPGSVNFGVATGYQQKVLGPDFTVWSFVYDISGLTSVTLKWRTDNDGVNPLGGTQNETYAGGSEVGAWQAVAMNRRVFPRDNIYAKPEINYYILPDHIAEHCSAAINGQKNKLIDYYIEAVDTRENVARSPIQHVWVGDQTGGPDAESRATVVPDKPVAGQQVMIQYNQAGGPLGGASAIKLHYGINGWSIVYSPDPSMVYNPVSQRWETTITLAANATRLDFVFNDGGGGWDNNSGADWHIPVSGAPPPPTTPWTLDGNAESGTLIRAQISGGLKLWAAAQGSILYVGAQSAAGTANDHFIFIARSPGASRSAPWAKTGAVAAWDAFLANESTNNWCGWFDSTGSTNFAGFTEKITGGTGKVIEGTIDLRQLYSTGGISPAALPSTVYLCAAEYGTSDGGSLVNSTQVPATVNSDGNIDLGEFLAFPINAEVHDWMLQ